MSSYDRRSFLGYFSSLGLSSTLFPGVLWAKIEATKAAAKEAQKQARDAKRKARAEG